MFTVAKTPEEMRSVFSIYPIDKSYTISTTKYSDSLIECTTYIYMIKLVGKYGSVFFLVLSLFIIINFISTSISYRKKEIGILRAIGASKKDISRVFNAETFIVGLSSGVLGILVTILLNIPINIIIKNIVNISNISKLPILGAIILVLISVLLTIIAGLIPSKVASKKDPVEALRSE